MVVCHDRPALQGEYDERLQFLDVDLPVPSANSGVSAMDDKWTKLALVLIHLADSPPAYTMFVDADDLVSRHLGTHVKKDAHPNGYIIKNGYLYHGGRRWLQHLRKTFNPLSPL